MVTLVQEENPVYAHPRVASVNFRSRVVFPIFDSTGIRLGYNYHISRTRFKFAVTLPPTNTRPVVITMGGRQWADEAIAIGGSDYSWIVEESDHFQAGLAVQMANGARYVATIIEGSEEILRFSIATVGVIPNRPRTINAIGGSFDVMTVAVSGGEYVEEGHYHYRAFRNGIFAGETFSDNPFTLKSRYEDTTYPATTLRLEVRDDVEDSRNFPVAIRTTLVNQYLFVNGDFTAAVATINAGAVARGIITRLVRTAGGSSFNFNIVSANDTISISRNGEVRQLQTYTSAGTVLITAQMNHNGGASVQRTFSILVLPPPSDVVILSYPARGDGSYVYVGQSATIGVLNFVKPAGAGYVSAQIFSPAGLELTILANGDARVSAAADLPEGYASDGNAYAITIIADDDVATSAPATLRMLINVAEVSRQSTMSLFIEPSRNDRDYGPIHAYDIFDGGFPPHTYSCVECTRARTIFPYLEFWAKIRNTTRQVLEQRDRLGALATATITVVIRDFTSGGDMSVSIVGDAFSRLTIVQNDNAALNLMTVFAAGGYRYSDEYNYHLVRNGVRLSGVVRAARYTLTANRADITNPETTLAVVVQDDGGHAFAPNA